MLTGIPTIPKSGRNTVGVYSTALYCIEFSEKHLIMYNTNNLLTALAYVCPEVLPGHNFFELSIHIVITFGIDVLA